MTKKKRYLITVTETTEKQITVSAVDESDAIWKVSNDIYGKKKLRYGKKKLTNIDIDWDATEHFADGYEG